MLNLQNCSWDEFFERVKRKELYCFGSGNLAEWLSYEVCGLNISLSIIAFVDNDLQKEGSFVRINNQLIPIISFDTFVGRRNSDTIMLITSMYYKEMIEQMDKIPALNQLECYIEVFLEEDKISVKEQDLAYTKKEEIPELIHYCWFGKKELPSKFKYYLDSWKYYCPHYQIICWDESNYDYKKITYTKQAYEAGKYAFVSDYARLDIVYNHGGIYLDVDVELIKPLDALRKNKMFCGFEQGNYINTGLGFGACRGFQPLKEMRDIYNNISFIDKNGQLNLAACTKYQTDYLVKKGMKRNGRAQIIDEINILPRTVFAPLDFYSIHNNLSPATHTIHHYAATWFDRSREELLKINNELKQRMRN